MSNFTHYNLNSVSKHPSAFNYDKLKVQNTSGFGTSAKISRYKLNNVGNHNTMKGPSGCSTSSQPLNKYHSNDVPASTLPNLSSEAFSRHVKNSTQLPMGNNICKSVDISKKTDSELSSSELNSSKKFVHINRSNLVLSNPKEVSLVGPTSSNRNIYVNPRNKSSVHVNSAKLHVFRATDKDIVNKQGDHNLISSKRSIYINPKYNINQNNELLNDVKGKGPKIYENTTGCDILHFDSVNKLVDQNSTNNSSKIHFNKNFIKKDISLLQNVQDITKAAFKTSTSSQKTDANICGEAINSNILHPTLIPQKLNSMEEIVDVLKPVNSSIDCNERRNTEKETCDNVSENKSMVRSQKLCVTDQKLNKSLTSGSRVLLKNNRFVLKFKDKQNNQSSKLIKVGDKVFRVVNVNKNDQKQTKCKGVLSNENYQGKIYQNHSITNMLPQNRLQTKVKSTNNSIRGVLGSNKFACDLKTVSNNSKQMVPVLNRSNTHIKSKEFIKLSKLKLVRRKRQLSTNEKVNSQLNPKVNEQSTSSCYKKNKVWIAPEKKTKLNSHCLNLTKDNCNTIVKYVKPSLQNKYSLNRLDTKTKQNFVKVNCLKTNIKKAHDKLAHSSSRNLTLQKGKYGVVKNKVLLRKNLQNSFISLSPNKLIRNRSVKSTATVRTKYKTIYNQLVKNTVSQVQNKMVKFENKPSPTLRMAQSVKSKYKLIRNSNVVRSKMKWSATGVIGNNLTIQRTAYNLKTKGYNNELMRSRQRQRKKSVTIGGIKYHTTSTKLQRKFVDNRIKKSNKIFNYKGNSFRVSKSGKSLKRLIPANAVSYLKQTNLVRFTSNASLTDFARNKAIQAKQRSIALLTKKLRKNNEPCLIFNRFGRCSGKDKGTCIKLHDKKRVAICRKFLQGSCENKNCLLSHDVGLSKMPTCKHYLAGICIREECPYLHVKLNSSAPVCVPFLQGYCVNAEKCKKRHIDICPNFEEHGMCAKGKSCPYPHPKNNKKITKLNDSDKLLEKQDLTCEDVTDSNERLSDNLLEEKVSSEGMDGFPNRYYNIQECNVDGGEVELKYSKETFVGTSDCEQSGSGWLGGRPKLGSLPSFIPLDDFKVEEK